jgi:hypothetical protein
VRKVGAVAMVVLAMTLAACGRSRTVPPTTQSGLGVVSGYADACAGPQPVKPNSHVTVLLYAGPSLVGSETIRAGATYRFSVPPGSYRVIGPGEAPKVVVTQAGRVITDNIPDMCK